MSYDTRLVGYPGVGRFIVGLWTALIDQGADIVAIGPGKRREDWLGEAGYRSPGAVITSDARPFRPAEQLALPRLLRKVGAEVHHSPHLAVPYLTRLPIVLTVHDLFFYKDPGKARSSLAGRYYRAAFPAAVRRASMLVGGSPYAARELSEILGVPDSRLRTVEYGLDLEQFRPVPTQEGAAQLAPLGVKPPYILYVGTAKPHKNLATLIAAHRGADLPPLVLAGPTRREVAAACPDWRDDGRVKVLGRVADEALPALYSAAAAVAVPSLYESVGFTALEAMACGAAVITSDGGGLPDTVGNDGLIVPATDVGAWRDALSLVVADDTLRSRLVAGGIARARQRSWARAARRYREIYQEVAN